MKREKIEYIGPMSRSDPAGRAESQLRWEQFCKRLAEEEARQKDGRQHRNGSHLINEVV